MPTRVPRTIPQFNAYITITDDYLQAAAAEPPFTPNWQRLGLTQADANQWHSWRQQWVNDLYVRYSSAVTKSKSVNANVATSMEAFRHFAQPLLRIMATSLDATVADAAVFNFKIGRSKPSRMRTPITENCVIVLRNLGGGMVRLAFQTMHSSGRPARPPEADSIIIAYKVGGAAPANAEDGTQWVMVTCARCIRSFGEEHRGQPLYLFARWYNARYPHFAGPWSTMTSGWL